MSEPFLAEIKMVGFNFPPRNWAFCDGQTLPINQNQALFSLLGTTFGGNGQTTFALPDLRGRTPIHFGTSDIGTSHVLGQSGGEEAHTLMIAEMSQHRHDVRASSASGNSPIPTGNVLASANNVYGPAQNMTPIAAGSDQAAGNDQAHENMQPFLAVNFCIALQGIFPSRS